MAQVEINERSYGIIPLRLKEGEETSATPTTTNTEVLLIFQKTLRPNMECYWTFAKGHAEPDDATIHDCAMRELREETGLVVTTKDFVPCGQEIFENIYTNPRTQLPKAVRYWPALVPKHDGRIQVVEVQAEEVMDYRWCAWSEALQLLDFESSRSHLRKLAELIEPGVNLPLRGQGLSK